ncbi:MAG: Lrp/AsnC family transcriptional regulator, partial [Candidatus Diapherotrites archaeon]|nr:Lrp/AsnC family transcriptional regulator [Candidatus Diapherotrites archaeon]
RMDKFDVKILNLLLEENNLKYKEIAKKLGTTIATVHNRIKKMEDEKVLLGFAPVIDSKKTGYDINALINVEIKGGHLEKLEKKYSKHKNICAVYDVTGNFDCVLVAKFKTTAEMNLFVKQLMSEEFVNRTNTSLILNTVKESSNPFPME